MKKHWLSCKGGRTLWMLRGGLLAAGTAFLGVGLARGEAQVVLAKAIRICLECIGIG